MRKLIIASALAVGLAAPAVADTLEAVTTKGVVLTVMDMEIPVTYAADGTYTADALGQTINGQWRIEGKSLCSSNDMQPEETCQEYPEGKGPGDSFDLEGPMGTATIKINE